jgi:hypothetical protein
MAYGYYASITIDNTKVSGSVDLTNFPILVSGTYDGTGTEPDIRTVANGGNIENVDTTGGVSGAYTVPADLTFSPNTDGSTPYAFEIESYNATTGAIIAWVKIPTLDYDDDTVLYMVYGDSGVTTSQEDINNVWTAYKNTYHLNGSYDATSGEVKDSTSLNNGTAVSGRPPVQATGKVGYGQDFQKGDVITFGDTTDLDAATRLVIEFWLNPDTISTNDVYVRKYEPDNKGFTMQMFPDNSGDIGLFIVNSGQRLMHTTDDPFTTGGGWYHLTAVWDASDNSMYYYVNGATRTRADYSTQTTQTALPTGTGILVLGGYTNGSGSYDYFADAQIDEFRLSVSESITADWAYTNYATQNDPSTFYAMGDETAINSADEASVSPLTLAISFPSVTATYTAVVSASVSPLTIALTQPEVTAIPAQVETASVSPLQIELTPVVPTPTYLIEVAAEVSPLLLELTPKAMTAQYTTEFTTPSKLVIDAITGEALLHTHKWHVAITDLRDKTGGKGASLIGSQDAGGHFTATTVEGILQEIGERLEALEP